MILKSFLCFFLSVIVFEKGKHQVWANTVIETVQGALWIAAEPQSQLLQALETVNEIEDSPTKVMLLNDIASEYIKFEQKEPAKFLLEQAVTISNQLSDQSTKIDLLTDIAKNYAEINELNQAKAILALTIEMANSVENKLIRGQLLLTIALS